LPDPVALVAGQAVVARVEDLAAMAVESAAMAVPVESAVLLAEPAVLEEVRRVAPVPVWEPPLAVALVLALPLGVAPLAPVLELALARLQEPGQGQEPEQAPGVAVSG
jgi:hypothetical protein